MKWRGGHREKTREDDDELVVVRKREVSAVIAEEVGRREMMLSGQGKSEAAKRRGRKEARTGGLSLYLGRKETHREVMWKRSSSVPKYSENEEKRKNWTITLSECR